MDFIIKFIGMAIVHTGGLCTLMFKRVYGEFIEIALGHHDNHSQREFFTALANSPNRAALYTEFDLSPFVQENNDMWRSLTGLPKVDIELKSEHLYQFLAFNLGENYLITLSEEQRLAIAQRCFAQRELKSMLVDCMSFLSGIDFQFFMPVRLYPETLKLKEPPLEEDLIAVVRDYSRMLVLYRQRIVMEDSDAYSAELDYEKVGSEEFFKLIRQKLKRQFIWEMHNDMLDELYNLADSLQYLKLKEKVKAIKDGLPKEGIPMPKPVPDYILKHLDWINEPTIDKSNKNIVALILGD